ncbi:hypothetical protein [Kocuria palustris]|uniref:hypothetical protein n=1 Tax=Kocuria palustris TaxID=71999 RepID=UPI0011A6A37B|nr:hypothetical protein [Kocuria palustris]
MAHITVASRAALRPIRRGAAAVLALALLLSACTPQPDDTQAEAAGGDPSDEQSAPSAAPSEAQAEVTPSAEETADDAGQCSDDDYDYVLLELVSCDHARKAVRGVVDNGKKTHLSVEDGKTACTPGSGRWTCTFAGEKSPATIELEPRDPEDDPLAETGSVTALEPESGAANPSKAPGVSGLGTYADAVDAECFNDDYDFADVQGLDCAEVDDVMQGFLDQQVEGVMDGVRCNQGTEAFDDGTREMWACIRMDGRGGSFIAYAR